MPSLPVTGSRRRRAFSLFVSAALLLALFTLAVVGVDRSVALDGQAEAVPGELIVGFTPTATAWQEQRAVDKARGEVADRIESVDAAVVTVDPDRTADASERLLRNTAVDFVEPNYVLRSNRIPNDRNFGDQWGLRNLGHFDGKVGADISATAAWDVTTATNAIVAVVDTGVAYTHPDLIGNAWRNPGDPVNGADDDGDGFTDNVFGADFFSDDSNPDDDGGHGTHVAGIVGAQGNNALGVTGVNWDVSLMALKFLDENGEGNTADAANAIDFAVAHGRAS